MKTLIVATDFSPAALNAANYAADMAMAINAELLLLHVFHIPVSYHEVPVERNEYDFMIDAKKELEQLRNGLLTKTERKIRIRTEVINALFFEGLTKVCEREKPYSVIIGSQGTTATERLLFGGHAVYAMQHLQWPLVTVPIGSRFSSIKKIGLACDFENIIGSAPIDEIKALVNDFKAELHVLNIGKEGVYNPEMVFELALFKEMLLPLKPIYHLVTSENTNQEILDFAEKQNIDLLLVLPKKHGFMERLMNKSHTKQMVLHSQVPVAALHAIDY